MYYISQIYLYCDIQFTKHAITEIKTLRKVSSTTLFYFREIALVGFTS